MPGTIIYVASATELLTALGTATGGETIYLRSGDYGDVDLSNLHFSSMVTIASETPLGALFKSININSSDHLRIEGIELEYILSEGEAYWTEAVNIDNSSYIEIINSDLHGSVDGNYDNDMYIMGIKQSSNIILSNNSFHDAMRAVITDQSENIQILDNKLFDIRTDGLDFIGVINLRVEGNSFTDWHPNLENGDHPDAIQFWNSGSPRESGQVVIANNTFIQGEGEPFQSILFGSVVDGMGYYDISITGNLIYTENPHGITISHGRDVSISNNTILQFPGGLNTPGIIVKSAAGPIDVYNNASALQLEDSTYLSQSNNIEIQNTDSSLPTYYGNLFFDAFSGSTATLEDFIPQPGGLLDSGTFIGAYQYSPITDTLQAQISSTTYHGTIDGLNVTLDGSHTTDVDGNPGEIDATYLWDFGDGTSGDGILVNHTYLQEGNYTAVLTVTRDGVSDSTTHTVTAIDPHILQINNAASSDIISLAANMASTEDSLNFDGSDYVNLGRPTELFDLDEFYLSFDVKPAEFSENSASLFYSHQRYDVTLKGDVLIFTIFTEGGTINTLKVNNADIFDGQFHNIALSFDSAKGTITAFVDNIEAGSLSGIIGSIEGVGSWDVTLGATPWGNNFTGEIDNVNVWSSTQPVVVPTVPITTTTDTTATTTEPILDTTTFVEPVVTTVTTDPEVTTTYTNSSITTATTEDVTIATATSPDTTTTTTEPTLETTTATTEDVTIATTTSPDTTTTTTEPTLETTTIVTSSSEPVVGYETNMFLSIADGTDAGGYTAVGNAVIGTDALIFNGKGYVDLGQDADLFGLDAFTLSFDITASTEKNDNKGVVRLVWNQEQYGIEMDGEDVIFRIQTDTGDTQVLRALDVGLNDGASHNIVMSYDSALGVLSGYVDDALVVEASGITGSIAEASGSGVTIGGGERGRNFEGEIDNLTMWSDADHTPDATYSSPYLAVLDTSTDTNTTTISDSTDPSLTTITKSTTGDAIYNPDDYYDSSIDDNPLV